jgi:hypothetical protein
MQPGMLCPVAPCFVFQLPASSHAAQQAVLCVLLQEASGAAMPPACSAPVDDDVAAEEARMRELLAARIGARVVGAAEQ